MVRHVSTPLGPFVPGPALPTLRPGLDPLPQTCCHCGSALLSSEEPLGGHGVGRVWCTTCSRQLAWLASSLRSQLRVTSYELRDEVRAASCEPEPLSTRSSQLGAERPTTRNSQLVSNSHLAYGRRLISTERFERLESCGPMCTERYGHHPTIHEQYGRDALLEELRSRPTGQVTSGPLCVDFDAGGVTVDGAGVYLTPIEGALLVELAVHVGCRRSQVDLVRQVWDSATAEACERSSDWHGLRTHIARLRGRLGPASRQIETIPWRGYRLLADSNEETAWPPTTSP